MLNSCIQFSLFSFPLLNTTIDVTNTVIIASASRLEIIPKPKSESEGPYTPSYTTGSPVLADKDYSLKSDLSIANFDFTRDTSKPTSGGTI
jgi:hypothetical protein